MAPVTGPGTVEAIRRLSGGASRETWAFDVVDSAGECWPFVLRRDPGGHGGQSERSLEYAILEAAAAGGVAVPAVRVLLQPAHGLGSGFVMDRVEGETIARRILRNEEFAAARTRLAAQCGEAAARIHEIDTAT